VILLTRLDRSKILVNIESIKFVESTPDTLIQFINGDSLIVLETQAEFLQIVEKYQAHLFQLSQKGN